MPRCDQCGAGNSRQASYCSSCGTPLPSKIRCPSCRKTLPAGSKFCIYCGTQTVGSGQLAARRAGPNKPKLPRGYSMRRTEVRAKSSRGRTATVLVTAVVTAATVALIAVQAFRPAQAPRATASPATKAGVSANLNSGSGAQIAWSEQVQRVASRFNCPCEKCGVVRLDECTCDIPRGSVEVKTYIRKLVDENLPEGQIIQKVEERYGHRIT